MGSLSVTENRQSCLIFAKVEVAYLKRKTFPILELLAIYSEILANCLEGLWEFIPTIIHVAADSQVVLSWIFSRAIVSKNLFGRNRQKDVLQISTEMESLFGITHLSRYVLTMENPADVITMGMTLKKFTAYIQFWCHGVD